MGVVAAKRLTTRKLTHRAATAYTHVWNKVIAEMNNTRPKTQLVPPNFKGKNKYERARTYKNRIIAWARSHPKKYGTVLYRGVKEREAIMFLTQQYVNKVNLSSFSKHLVEAQAPAFSVTPVTNITQKAIDPYLSKFPSPQKIRNVSVILRYDPKTKRIPSINYTENGNFKSYYESESEILLIPGTFIVKSRRMWIEQDTLRFLINVDYVPK